MKNNNKNDTWINLFLFFLITDKPETVLDLIQSDNCEEEFTDIVQRIVIMDSKCFQHRIKFLDNERFDVEFKCQCGEIVKVESEERRMKNKNDTCFICGKCIERGSVKRIEPPIDNIILPGSTEKHPVCDTCGNILAIVNMLNSQGGKMI